MTVLAPHADFLDTVATVVGVVGALSSLLQTRKAARTHSAESESLGFLAKYLGGYVTWALYGMAIGSTPLMVVDLIGSCTSNLTVGVALRVRHAADEALTAIQLAWERHSTAAISRSTESLRWRVHEVQSCGRWTTRMTDSPKPGSCCFPCGGAEIRRVRDCSRTRAGALDRQRRRPDRRYCSNSISPEFAGPGCAS